MGCKALKSDSVDLKAGYYEKNSGLQNNLAREILNAYRINPYAYILDVGCGDGRITAELARLAKQGEVIGIDSSPSMIEFASTQFSKTMLPNLTFVQKSAEAAIFPRRFDLIVSFSCLHWLREPEAAFRQLSASLKQKGELLVLTYPRESLYYQYLEKALEKYPDYKTLSAYHTMLSTDGYQDLLDRNDLEILNFQRYDLLAEYNDSNEIKEFIEGWLNSYVPLPEDLHEKFLQDVCQAILDDPRTRKDDNKLTIPYSALVFRARKK